MDTRVDPENHQSGAFSKPRAVVRKASEITIEQTDWLWHKRLPKGTLAILAGLPNVGKGHVLSSLIAAITETGIWPDGSKARRGNVVVLQSEEHVASVYIPHLKAAGAELDRVILVDGMKTSEADDADVRFTNLTKDIAELEAAIKLVGNVHLVVIDPIASYMGSLNSQNNDDIRRVLDPLVVLANETGACILIVKHEVKGSGYKTALAKISGGSAWGEVPRMAFEVDQDPDDRETRRLMQTKASHGFQPSLAFHIEERIVEGVESSCAVWDGETDITADEAMRDAENPDRVKKPTAGNWLKDYLITWEQEHPNEKAYVNDIEEAAKEAGLGWDAVKKARQRPPLDEHVRTAQEGLHRPHYWWWE